MNGPTPGPQDAHTPSPWSTVSGLETTEKHQTTICCLAWHLTHKTLSSYIFLSKASSYHFFKPLNDLLITGPTQTNVMDLRIILVG
jgi:hypothetical protein